MQDNSALSVDLNERLNQAVQCLGSLVSFPTVSSDSNLALIEFIADFFSKAGAKVEIWKSPDGNKANCFATFGEGKSGGVVLSGHSDVVPVTGQDWTTNPFEMRKDGTKLFGRGTCDMKGFIACTMAMADIFASSNLKRPIHIALTYDEETGCLGGRQLVDDLVKSGYKPSVCIIGEPTSLRIIDGHKGCNEYRTHFTGLATHGSMTHVGVNAIEYAALYISRLMAIREELKNSPPEGVGFTPPYTTLQIGEIQGGVSRNTIAGDCIVDWEMRPVKKSDADYVKEQIDRYAQDKLLPAMRERAPSASIKTETIGEVIGLTPAAENEARDICFKLTGAQETSIVSFGTEAGLFQEIGIATVVCGPGSIEQAHKPDEFIEVDELAKCLEMLQKLTDHLH